MQRIDWSRLKLSGPTLLEFRDVWVRNSGKDETYLVSDDRAASLICSPLYEKFKDIVVLPAVSPDRKDSLQVPRGVGSYKDIAISDGKLDTKIRLYANGFLEFKRSLSVSFEARDATSEAEKRILNTLRLKVCHYTVAGVFSESELETAKNVFGLLAASTIFDCPPVLRKSDYVVTGFEHNQYNRSVLFGGDDSSTEKSTMCVEGTSSFIFGTVPVVTREREPSELCESLHLKLEELRNSLICSNLSDEIKACADGSIRKEESDDSDCSVVIHGVFLPNMLSKIPEMARKIKDLKNFVKCPEKVTARESGKVSTGISSAYSDDVLNCYERGISFATVKSSGLEKPDVLCSILHKSGFLELRVRLHHTERIYKMPNQEVSLTAYTDNHIEIKSLDQGCFTVYRGDPKFSTMADGSLNSDVPLSLGDLTRLDRIEKFVHGWLLLPTELNLGSCLRDFSGEIPDASSPQEHIEGNHRTIATSLEGVELFRGVVKATYEKEQHNGVEMIRVTCSDDTGKEFGSFVFDPKRVQLKTFNGLGNKPITTATATKICQHLHSRRGIIVDGVDKALRNT